MEKEPEPFSEEKAEVVMEDESMAEEKEMSEERVKDILKKTKERVLFDAKLIQGGAHYVLDQGSQDFRLEPTEKQVKEIKKESNYSEQEQKYIERVEKMIDNEKIKKGDHIWLIAKYDAFSNWDRSNKDYVTYDGIKGTQFFYTSGHFDNKRARIMHVGDIKKITRKD